MPVEGSELSRVLGGGIVPGSVVLVSGDPGIGKSTLLLQLAASMARTEGRVLYVSAEESARQLKLRASRLGIHEANLYVLRRDPPGVDPAARGRHRAAADGGRTRSRPSTPTPWPPRPAA